jgi:CIC family chloride channel protein
MPVPNALRQLYLRTLDRAKVAEHTFMVVAAVAVGVAAGYGAVALRTLIEWVQHMGFGVSGENLGAADLPAWQILLVPAVGGLLAGPVIYLLAREAKGHGVPQVMEAVAVREGVMRPRVAVAKTLASALTIGSGGSSGREGPIVQIGSAIGSSVGQVLRMSGRRLRTLVGCGAAGGIAAAFNAPVAGALFSLEIILGDFGVSHFSPIVISSVTATVISRHYYGDFPAFQAPPYNLVSAWELLLYGVLGVLAGVLALVYERTLHGTEALFDRRVPGPAWLKPAMGGALLGVLALQFPQVLGVGYGAIGAALEGEMALWLLAALAGAKILATSLTLGSGGSGGIFAPSLFMGAMSGGFVGTLAHRFLPDTTAGPGAYALVGMGAMVAGVTHAPITAIVMLFELTSSYTIILPLMISCIIATVVAQRLDPESIYTRKLVDRGIEIRRGKDVNVLRAIQVQDVFQPGIATVSRTETLRHLMERLAELPHAHLYLADDNGRFTGMVTVQNVRRMLVHHHELRDLLTASDVEEPSLAYVTPNDSADDALRLLRKESTDELPVVDPNDPGVLLGTVSRRTLLDAYYREVFKRDLAGEVLAGVQASERMPMVPLVEGYFMAQMEAPGAFLGRTLRDLNLRATHDAQVILIRRSEPGAASVSLVPDPAHRIARGDILVLVGRESSLKKLHAL